MNRKFSFDPKKTLIKPCCLIDMIIHALPADNDDFYIEHPIDSNSFTLKRKYGR